MTHQLENPELSSNCIRVPVYITLFTNEVSTLSGTKQPDKILSTKLSSNLNVYKCLFEGLCTI